jgi:hypothetical protein
MANRTSVALGFVALALSLGTAARAENRVDGALVVEGKPVKLTHVYAFAQTGFFDEKKDDVVVLFCDGEVPQAGVRDRMERHDLVKAGKLHCVEQTIDAEKHVINFKVEHSRFGPPEGGGSTYHVFEAKTFNGKTVAGRSRTTEPQKSFDDVPYSYDITFGASIEAKK